MKISLISDTHNKHKQIEKQLRGGLLLIHAGDISSMGYNHEIENFCKWFDGINGYIYKIFIAGNHDFGFENYPNQTMEIISKYPGIIYLQDNLIEIEGIKIYGSPWQPEFYNWAFNLPRNGKELEEKWNMVPEDVDILITHGPAFGYVDKVIGRDENLGCEKLVERIKNIKPKIHVCGHIHSGYGYVFDEGTHYINASVLNERYIYSQKPFTIEWNKENNEIKFL